MESDAACIINVSVTKEVKLRLAKCPLIFNGRLANRGLTSLVKEVTVVNYKLTPWLWTRWHEFLKCIASKKEYLTIHISPQYDAKDSLHNKTALIQAVACCTVGE